MPEPILIAIAAALASKSAGSLYELVKRKLNENPESATALEAADGKPADSPEVAALSDELALAEQTDPKFSESLRALWQQVTVTQKHNHGSVINNISGTITGNVVQTRDIEGDISF